jgi:hypothetical protein
MLKRLLWMMLPGLLVVSLAGCGGDPAKKMLAEPEMQARLIDLMVADSTISEVLVTRLLGTAETRTMVLERSLADGATSQELMLRIAKDPAFVNGVIGVAMQDPTMKGQLMTLFEGMQMARP